MAFALEADALDALLLTAPEDSRRAAVVRAAYADIEELVTSRGEAARLIAEEFSDVWTPGQTERALALAGLL